MNLQDKIKAAEAAFEALGIRIQELKSKAETKESRKPTPGDVYGREGDYWVLDTSGTNVMFPGCIRGGHSHSEVAESKRGQYCGRFEEVFFTREQLKKKFLKMRDVGFQTPEECIETVRNFAVDWEGVDSFIDNLLDGKNCDGSPVDEENS